MTLGIDPADHFVAFVLLSFIFLFFCTFIISHRGTEFSEFFARESPRMDKGISSPLRGVANRLEYPYHKITFKNMTCNFNMGLYALNF